MGAMMGAKSRQRHLSVKLKIDHRVATGANDAD